MGRGVDWTAQDVAQRAGGSMRAENHARCVHCGQIGRWRASRRRYQASASTSEALSVARGNACIAVRLVAGEQQDEDQACARPVLSEVFAEIETAVTETPLQTLSVLRRHSSLDMSRSTLWRALHEDLQARCFLARPCATIDS